MRKISSLFLLFFVLVVLIYPQNTAALEEQSYIVLFEDVINEQLIEESGATITDKLTNSPIVMIHADREALQKLQEVPAIRSIEVDSEMELAAQRVNWGIGPSKVQTAWKTGYTGKGVKIAVIDSGIGPHDDLKVVKSVSFLKEDETNVDRNGHGTHIAGIIGALDNNIGVKGIAPDAELYALKVFNQEGVGSTSDVIRAIDWSIEHQMDIINLSLTSKAGSEAYEQIVNRAYEKGSLLVAAAGNETLTDPSIDNVEYPARYANAIAVASINQSNKKGYFSSIGPTVEISAPGEKIYSTYLGNGYAIQSGTSLATAFISGQLALMKEAYPYLSNRQLRKKMIDNVIDLGPKGRDSVFGYGSLQTSSYDRPLYEYPATNNPVINLTLSSNSIVGDAGSTVGTQLIATFKNGLQLNVADFAIWTSTDKAVASSRGGRIDLLAEGQASLRATYGGLTIDVPVEVKRNLEPTGKVLLPFTDVQSNYWAIKEINDIYAKLIITGYEDGKFKPGDAIKREHVAVMMARTIPMEKEKTFKAFPDVSMHSPYFYEIMKTQQAGIFSGNETGFGPNDFLTRGQMAKVIVEAFNLPKSTSHPFPDVKNTHWEHDYVAALYAAGITTGSDGQFKSSRYVTRAEFTVFIQRALAYK